MKQADFSFTRGDTLPLEFSLADGDGNNVAIDSLNSLILTCRKRNTLSSPIIFQKNIEDFEYDSEAKKYTVTIQPEDTRELMYGYYNFDIQVNYGGVIETRKSSFSLTAEDTIFNPQE